MAVAARVNLVVPDDYDKVYRESPHLARLAPHGQVRVYSEPPRDEAALLENILAFLAGHPTNVVNPEVMSAKRG